MGIFKMKRDILFIDPSSKSCGWAKYSFKGKLMCSGTVTGKGLIEARLLQIVKSLESQVLKGFDGKIVIERMNYKAHYYLHWMIGALICQSMVCSESTQFEFMSPSEWKKYLEGYDLEYYRSSLNLKSEDEAVAILMGKAWFSK
jgi:hypothetical protein